MMKNLQNLITRLNNHGGAPQQDRMIKDKQRTLQRAVQYSYQGADIQLLNSEEIIKALINPNKLLADYDEKILSVDFNKGFKSGTIFRWITPEKNSGDTYWLIYLQDLTELAYFKANIRRCTHEIKWKDEEQEYSTYIAIKGPTEKKIASVSSNQFTMDVPNYSLSILMPKNEYTLKHFQRYVKFYLQDDLKNNTPICWRVEAIDSISTPNILEVYAKEYYINEQEDDVTNGIVGGKIEPIIPNEQIKDENEEIVGDNFIKPGFEYCYEYIGDDVNSWEYDSNLPISTKIVNNKIYITWTASYTDSFILTYGSYTKTIVVESLF